MFSRLSEIGSNCFCAGTGQSNQIGSCGQFRKAVFLSQGIDRCQHHFRHFRSAVFVGKGSFVNGVANLAALADDERRHDLGGAGNQAPVAGVLLIEHPSGGSVQNDGLFRRKGTDRTQKKDGGHKDRRRPKKHCFHILTRG